MSFEQCPVDIGCVGQSPIGEIMIDVLASKGVVVVAIDFEKAFDSVGRLALVIRLKFCKCEKWEDVGGDRGYRWD